MRQVENNQSELSTTKKAGLAAIVLAISTFAISGSGDKEGKCGEGSCGEKKAQEPVDDKAEGKCGEGSCGEKKVKKGLDAKAEGKCGEGSCGEKK